MKPNINFDQIKDYFSEKLALHGATPRGMDWNSLEAQEARFNQLAGLIKKDQPFTVIDYGCGYGGLIDYLLAKNLRFEYYGYDILDEMIVHGQQMYNQEFCHFTSQEDKLPPQVDYTIANGIFNMKLQTGNQEWTEYVFETLTKMNNFAKRGIAFNLLTKYSDPEYMRDDLYYADPCLFFDYCKKHFAKDVALLHDYGLYDFTIIVRKQLD